MNDVIEAEATSIICSFFHGGTVVPLGRFSGYGSSLTA